MENKELNQITWNCEIVWDHKNMGFDDSLMKKSQDAVESITDKLIKKAKELGYTIVYE